jgi:hypothetical protein
MHLLHFILAPYITFTCLDCRFGTHEIDNYFLSRLVRRGQIHEPWKISYVGDLAIDALN